MKYAPCFRFVLYEQTKVYIIISFYLIDQYINYILVIN